MLEIFAASVKDDIIFGATPAVLSLARLITFSKLQNQSSIIVAEILVRQFVFLSPNQIPEQEKRHFWDLLLQITYFHRQ